MFAHPDSEPLSGLETWAHDPFAGIIADGRLYGWGIADDLAGIAVGTLALARAARAGAPLGDVVMISAPSKRHARGVAAAMHQGLVADGALYLHPAESGAGLNEIKAFAAGQLEFRITVRGKFPPTNEPGHTAFAHLAVNPIDKAILLHAALRALDADRGARIHHPALEKEVGRSTNILISNMICGEEYKLGRVNEVCTLSGAISFPPGETLDQVKAEVEAALAAACAADPWLADTPATIDWLTGVTGAECPPEHPLYLVAARAVSAQTGSQPHVNPMHTSSDIRNPIVQKAIPTVGLGGLCGDLTQNGRRDEWVDVDDYLRTIAAATAIILDWCGTPRAA
jgi:acetylornithine deacetylase